MVEEFFIRLWDNLSFIFQRLTWLSAVDLALVTGIFFALLLLLRDTQAIVLLRGVLLLVVLGSVLSGIDQLPAFSWLVQTTLPALLLAIPVIFAPEIRRALERMGRAEVFGLGARSSTEAEYIIQALVTATMRLADRRHGALIVIKRHDSLDEYIQTGVHLDARATPELLLQIFYPHTPLHDGAVILDGTRIMAAACVMPLSASGVLTRSPERQMGLRHRAALGISEVTDAVVVVVSEETGYVSIVHGGRMIRRLDASRLENILRTFFSPKPSRKGLAGLLERLFPERYHPPSETKRQL